MKHIALSFMVALLPAVASAQDGIGTRILQKSILEDGMMDQVSDMARKTVATGLNAGDGYGEVWIRDFNTFITVAMDVMPDGKIRDCLNTFFRFQGPEGDIVDGYIPVDKADLDNTGGYAYRLSDSAPHFAAHKNTVETDQETSLIQAVFQYVEKSGNRAYLQETVDGKTVEERLEMALEYLYSRRFSDRYGLIYGATTADWGDVQPEHAWGVAIDENTHFAVDIYDNAMLAIALDDFVSLTGDQDRKKRWTEAREKIVENVRKYLWDSEKGKFIPHLYLDGSPFPESFDENTIYYHGGTAVAALAGMLTRDEIADANSKMLGNVRKAHARTIGLTMYPAYPAGYFKGVGMYPYGYQNGGDWTWFGARMIWALAENGFIREAYDELRPMLARVIENGGFNEWYTPAGEPMGSGTFRGEAGVLVTAIDMLREWAVQHDRVTMPEGPGVKVVFAFGQSNAANHGQVRHSASGHVVNYYKGECYPATDPLIGATGNDGSPWTRLADMMVSEGLADSVVIVCPAVGATCVGDWAEGGYLYQRLTETVDGMLEDGIKPDIILWHQGESDNIANTSEDDYVNRFLSIRKVFRDRGIEAPMVVAAASYHPACIGDGDGNDSAVRSAQKRLADSYDDIFPGPDTDRLDRCRYRHDGVHFSGQGQDMHAAMWLKPVKKTMSR